MVNAEPTHQMDCSNGEQNGNLDQNIPGGKQHQLPDEPEIPKGLCKNMHHYCSIIFHT